MLPVVSTFSSSSTMESASPMEARQRRMALRRQSTSKSFHKKDPEEDSIDNDDDYSYNSSSSKDNSTTSAGATSFSEVNKKRKTLADPSLSMDADLSMYRGIKKQARYEPSIPIASKVELAAWRKEARRIRNRESAAASRNKTRERIDELEEQLRAMQNQYNTALQRIVELEVMLLHQKGKSEVEASPGVSTPIDTPTNQVSPTLSSSKPIFLPTELNIATLDDDNNTKDDLLLWSTDHQKAAEALAQSLSYGIITPYEGTTIIPNIVAPELLPVQKGTNDVQVPEASLTTTIVPTNSNISTSTTSDCNSSTLYTTHQNIKISRPTAVCVVPI